jgi:hypothetical protein
MRAFALGSLALLMVAGSFTPHQRTYRAEYAQERSSPHQGAPERSPIKFAAIADAVQPRSTKESDNDPQQQEWWWEKAWRHWGRRLFADLKVTDVLIAISSVFLALFTWRLWVATDRLWEAARKQTLHLANTAERQLRAYVYVADASILHTNSEYRPNIRITFKNFGQTPAYQVRNTCRFTLMRTETVEEVVVTSHRSDLGPSQDRSTNLFISRKIWVIQRQMILSRAAIGVAYGKITYFDAFQNRASAHPRFTRYRFEIPVDDEGITEGGLLFSEEGNESS